MAAEDDVLDLFVAAAAQRDAAIALAGRSVDADPTAGEALTRVLGALMRRLHLAGDWTFSADLVGEIMDELNVAPDLATRRRLVSTFLTRGAKGDRPLWRKVGYVASHRRHGSPIVQWRLTEMTELHR